MPDAKDILGWTSSFILVFTIGFQLYRQSQSQSKKKVSKFLYLGQLLANIGFVFYSILLDNKVFIFTNSILVIENAVGFYYTLRKR